MLEPILNQVAIAMFCLIVAGFYLLVGFFMGRAGRSGSEKKPKRIKIKHNIPVDYIDEDPYREALGEITISNKRIPTVEDDET